MSVCKQFLRFPAWASSLPKVAAAAFGRPSYVESQESRRQDRFRNVQRVAFRKAAPVPVVSYQPGRDVPDFWRRNTRFGREDLRLHYGRGRFPGGFWTLRMVEEDCFLFAGLQHWRSSGPNLSAVPGKDRHLQQFLAELSESGPTVWTKVPAARAAKGPRQGCDQRSRCSGQESRLGSLEK